ncbi:MAG TPA: serine/threonine-protein kinase [Candidatus Obscuribacterales bacterium]
MQPDQLLELTPLDHEARVFRGLDREGRPVVLKTIALQRAGSWKELELFEREAKLLRYLSHARIPRLLAYGREDHAIWLITEWIPGQSLLARLAEGWRPSETEAWALARQLLEILDWLHGHQPPIVHRDIKPSNLILSPEGQLFLIDFGSVQLHPAGGSTVAGTFGYMAPEQFSGRALPASDLYALGATLVHLLSGRAPAEIPQVRLQLCFEPYVCCSEALLGWLQQLLAPMPEDRFASARVALVALDTLGQGGTEPAHASPILPAGLFERLPAPRSGFPGIRISRTAAGIEIVLPPRPLTEQRLRQYRLFLASQGFLPVIFWILAVILGRNGPLSLLLGLTLLSACAWEYRRYRRLTRLRTRLVLQREELLLAAAAGSQTVKRSELKVIRREVRGWNPHKTGVRLQYRFPEPYTLNCVLLGPTLDPPEQEWLCQLLLDWKHGMDSY